MQEARYRALTEFSDLISRRDWLITALPGEEETAALEMIAGKLDAILATRSAHILLETNQITDTLLQYLIPLLMPSPILEHILRTASFTQRDS